MDKETLKISEICSTKCFGTDGHDGSCCSIENRDYIIGPIEDSHEFIDNLSKKLGRKIDWNDVFIEAEEGKKLFPEKYAWKNENHYPAFRVDLNHPKKSCVFYNNTVKSCMVYDIRPRTCRTFVCPYLKSELEKIKEK
jgi:Fe-S-cluster containining protein